MIKYETPGDTVTVLTQLIFTCTISNMLHSCRPFSQSRESSGFLDSGATLSEDSGYEIAVFLANLHFLVPKKILWRLNLKSWSPNGHQKKNVTSRVVFTFYVTTIATSFSWLCGHHNTNNIRVGPKQSLNQTPIKACSTGIRDPFDMVPAYI